MPIPKLLMYNDSTISLSDALLGTWWLSNYITYLVYQCYCV